MVWRTSSQKKLRNVELLEKKQLLKKPQRKKQPLKRHSLTDPVKKLFLVGKKLSHSFSPNYFKQKFLKENIVDWNYAALELDQIEKIEKLRAQIDLAGFNVTIPYKTSIMPFLDELDTDAKQIGAVNTVVPISKGDGIALKGYNTDKPAFMATLEPIKEQIIGAMVLGSGGAAKAVKAGLDDLKIHHVSISRTGQLRYKDIDSKLLKNYNLIVNCTPLGMFPDTTTCPELPYEMLNSSNILYDLVYNPALTTFLQKGKHKNCFCLNGLRMLEIQADLSFELWKKNLI